MLTTREPIWNQFLTERDRKVFAHTGHGARQGWGKRPVLLIIDVNYNFCGDKPEPILESIKRWRNSCGEEAWVGVRAIARLIEASRAKGLPILYTTGAKRADNWDAGGWAWKNSRNADQPRTQVTNRAGDDIVEEIAPGPRDIMVVKQKPSAFAGTSFAAYLTLLGADSLIVTGTTTSGCVRAVQVVPFGEVMMRSVPDCATATRRFSSGE